MRLRLVDGARGRAPMLALLGAVAGGTALAAQLSAPAAERATFLVLAGADTFAVERATRTPTRLDGELTLLAQRVRFAYTAALAPDGTIPRMENVFFRDADSVVAQRARLELRGDSAIVHIGIAVAESGAVQRIRTGAGALPYLNPSVALLEQALVRARALAADSVTIPTFHLIGGATVPLTVRRLGDDSATFAFGPVVFRAAVRGDRIMGAAVPAQGVRVVWVEGHTGPVLRPLSYEAPLGAPYAAQEVRVRTAQGLTLAGTLTLPGAGGARGGRVPAVVTITGSGPQDRDGEPPSLRGYRPFRELADTLAWRGIAVLRLDDRGVGGSDAGPAGATSADFAADVRAALAYLRGRPEIDGTRLGLVGHSEGGLIGPIVAASDSAVRALVVMAGAASRGRDVLLYQQRYVVDSVRRLFGAARDAELARMARATDSIATVLPWVRFFLDHDPIAVARRVRVPVLIVHGAEDRQVPAVEAEQLAGALRAGGNRAVTVRVFPATNHLFVPDGGVGLEYARLPSFRVRREVLGAVADWLAATLR